MFGLNKERDSDSRTISLRAESVILPGRTLTTSTDSNIYGPDREIVEESADLIYHLLVLLEFSGLNMDDVCIAIKKRMKE